MDQRQEGSTHPVHHTVQERLPTWTIQVDGLVLRPLALDIADLASLPRVETGEPVSCHEHERGPDPRWQGIALADVLALAGPLPAARYVRVSAGGYALPVPLDAIAGAVLCDAVDGAPLPVERGAPWRLLLPDAGCWTSVKWVRRLEVTAEPGVDSAGRAAEARQASRRQ